MYVLHAIKTFPAFPICSLVPTCVCTKSAFQTVIVADCYVADEIITSRAKVRVKVGNTDAEGRMAMTDLLCRAKEWVSAELCCMEAERV